MYVEQREPILSGGKTKNARDLRYYLSETERQLPGHLVRVEKEIDSRFEVSALIRNLESDGKLPALLFENVKSISGTPGKRVLANLTAARRRICTAFDLPPEQWRAELTRRFADRGNKPIPPLVIDRASAPVRQVVKTGKDADLRELPMIYHHEMDGNPYGTMIVCMKKPDGMGYNTAYHRTMYKGPQKTGIHMSPFHSWRIYTENEKQGKPTPVVIVHGHHPAFHLSAAFMSPWTWDEYGTAGGMIGEALRLVPSETWGEEFLVPADAEVIIEGLIQPGYREPEGPFGEWPSYYGPQRQNPVIQVTAITHRSDYIWYDTDIGEIDFPGIGWEAEIQRRVEDALPGGLRGVHCPWSGQKGFHVYISINKLSEGLPYLAAMAAQTIGYPKLIVVVDDDVDPFDVVAVLQAVATRFQADKDMVVLPHVRGSMLDPSMEHLHTHTSLFIDATKPVNAAFPEKVKVPKEALDRIKIPDFIPQEIVDRIPWSPR
ncbi:MAG: UbiD family decarboxylase [Deltaproteobacteria bacterium]|nr:UbiD family decarboxylase [Deltaproteobacteria bacterium]